MQRIKFDLNKFMDSQERRLRETFDDNTAAIAGRLTRATIAGTGSPFRPGTP